MAKRLLQVFRGTVTTANEQVELSVKTRPGTAKVVGFRLDCDDPVGISGATIPQLGTDSGKLDNIDKDVPAVLFFVGPDVVGEKITPLADLIGDTVVPAGGTVFGVSYRDNNKAGTIYPYSVTLVVAVE